MPISLNFVLYLVILLLCRYSGALNCNQTVLPPTHTSVTLTTLPPTIMSLNATLNGLSNIFNGQSQLIAIPIVTSIVLALLIVLLLLVIGYLWRKVKKLSAALTAMQQGVLISNTDTNLAYQSEISSNDDYEVIQEERATTLTKNQSYPHLHSWLTDPQLQRSLLATNAMAKDIEMDSESYDDVILPLKTDTNDGMSSRNSMTVSLGEELVVEVTMV